MKTTQVVENGTNTPITNILLKTLVAFKKGNFSVRMPVDQTGINGKIADTLNDILELNQKMASELDRVRRVVGTGGKINQRASVGCTSGRGVAGVEWVNPVISVPLQPSTALAR